VPVAGVIVSKFAALTDDQISELERITKKLEGPDFPKKPSLFILSRTHPDLQLFVNKYKFNMRDFMLSEMEIEDLQGKHFIKILSKKEHQCVLTLKTIMLFEYALASDAPRLDKMLDDINKQFFERKIKGSNGKPMIARHKAVILGLLGLHAVSDSLLVSVTPENEEYIKESIDLGAEFLKQQSLDDGTLDRLWTNKVILESTVRSEFRQGLHGLKATTEGIFVQKKGTKKGDYLDICVEGSIDADRLVYLLGQIFNLRPPTYEQKEHLIEVLNRIQTDYGYRLFDASASSYSPLDVKMQIKRVIEDKL